jgi:hypothetical protein
MADESLENRDPGSERSGQAPRDGENREPDPSSNRRRIIITSLLTPPAVMTLNARAARAAASTHPSMSYATTQHKGKG